MGIEPMTSSLPRKRSTPELRRLIVFKGKSPKIGTINSRNSILLLINLSGWPGSNRRPTAWKAVALPTELHPLKIQKIRGGRRIRTFEDISQRIYSPSQLATLVSPLRTLFLTGYLWKGLQNYTDFLFIQTFDLKNIWKYFYLLSKSFFLKKWLKNNLVSHWYFLILKRIIILTSFLFDKYSLPFVFFVE